MSLSWKKRNLVNKGWVKIICKKKKRKNDGLKLVVVSSEAFKYKFKSKFFRQKKTGIVVKEEDINVTNLKHRKLIIESEKY